MFKKILVCSDGSDHALKAAYAAAKIAGKFNSSITMLHVVHLPLTANPAYEGVRFAIAPEEADRYASEIQDVVARRTGKVLDEFGLQFVTRQEVGHPAEVISWIANEEKFDLVVLGSRGLSGLKSFLLGSISDRVAHHAHCPVLIVR